MPNALVSIGGIELPTPSTYVGLTSTLVDAGRNVEGYVIGAVIRNDIGKVEMTWNYLTVDQWATILQLFTPALGGAFYRDVTFYDQVRATWVTREMYVSDRTTSGLFRLNPATGIPVGWRSPKLSLVEV
jgi:hypothetical protein